MAFGHSSVASKHLAIAVTETTITVTYSPTLEMTLGLPVRKQRALRLVRAGLSRANPSTMFEDENRIVAQYTLSEIKQLDRVVVQLERHLDSLAEQRLPPRVVRQLLHITGAELTRWHKDGRLPKSGTGQFQKGKQTVQYYTYRPAVILQLLLRPEIIADWRRQDAAGRTTKKKTD